MSQTSVHDVTQIIIIQIGRGNVLAISGGRWSRLLDAEKIAPIGAILPVSNGYTVEVELDFASDTYTVRRVFSRGGKRWVKGEVTNVYCDEVGEIAYIASCFRSYDFGEEVAK